MVGIIKRKLLLYAGTCEIVGGDTKYFCGLIDSIADSGMFDLVVAADDNDEFRSKIRQWMRGNIDVIYLPTKPVLMNSTGLDFVDNYIKVKILGRPISKYIRLFIKLVLLSSFREFLHNFFVFNRLFKQQKDIEVLHVNAGSYPGRIAGVAAVLAARVNYVPKTVMTVHNEVQTLIDPMVPVYDAIVRSSCDHLIPVSSNVEQSLKNKKKLKTSKLTKISVGLDDSGIPPSEELRNIHDEFTILIIGNYEEKRKGHAPLLSAIGELVKNHPNVKLQIAGTGSEERRAELAELVNALKIEKHIEWMGYVDNIDAVLRRSSVVAVPSTGPEAIPYTIIEALRAGKPVITSHNGGCSEAVINGFNGFVVDPYNTKEVSSKLALLVEDSLALQQFGRHSRQVFLEQFDQKEKMIAHFEIYNG
jgi:glycosyltransferase involved in cell wall biosynthesis